MTSLEIAELTGKQHKHVMEAIRKMEPAWVKVNGRNFALVEYKDAKGELRPIKRCQARCDTKVRATQGSMTKFSDLRVDDKVYSYDRFYGRTDTTIFPSYSA